MKSVFRFLVVQCLDFFCLNRHFGLFRSPGSDERGYTFTRGCVEVEPIRLDSECLAEAESVRRVHHPEFEALEDRSNGDDGFLPGK